MPQPYDQICVNGEPKKLYEGMYLEYVVGDLMSYTAYEFQVQSANDAGPIDFQVWVRAETTADGMSGFLRAPDEMLVTFAEIRLL